MTERQAESDGQRITPMSVAPRPADRSPKPPTVTDESVALALAASAHADYIDALGRLDQIEALLPAECWVTRSEAVFCADMIGGTLSNGAVFTEDACCLPCRVRRVISPANKRAGADIPMPRTTPGMPDGGDPS